jgi:exonuclease SbcC
MEQFKVAMDDQTKAETEREISVKNANEALQSAESKSTQLQTALATTEFKDILDLKSARMDSKAAEKIESLARELDKELAAFSALLEEALSEIQTLRGQSILEGEKAVAFKQSYSELSAKRDTWLEAKTTLQGVFSTDNANKERMVSEEAKLGDARKNLLVWKQLGELIGSHDGSKFRQIAQTISLDILTRHANKHLGKLSDRYRIQRETEGLLNLQIEDLHQAGAVRPMSSLSGGESFLASLALALGLSDLAGRTVRIDSLFIDEGFGSLDPDTLEVAIDALESLRQNQKTVGVISHVGLLKERIATQIIIEKEAGGRSRISLAG